MSWIARDWDISPDGTQIVLLRKMVDFRVIAKMDHSIIETALVQEFQHYADVDGKERLAGSNDDRRDEQMILVGEPGPELSEAEAVSFCCSMPS